jgi:hypothetical protein
MSTKNTVAKLPTKIAALASNGGINAFTAVVEEVIANGSKTVKCNLRVCDDLNLLVDLGNDKEFAHKIAPKAILSYKADGTLYGVDDSKCTVKPPLPAVAASARQGSAHMRPNC